MTIKKLLLLLALANTSLLSAGIDDTYYTNFGCIGPLEPGRCHMGIKPGIAPTLLLDKDPITSIVAIPIIGEHTISFSPDYEDLFKLPFWLAGEVGYSLADNLQIFSEVVWRYARGKSNVEVFTFSNLIKVNATLNNHSSLGAYLGMRYYTTPVFGCDPYCGFKFGILHHGSVCGDFDAVITADEDILIFKASEQLFVKNNVVSGAIVFGLSTSFWQCFTFQLGVEIMASGCLKPAPDIELVSNSIDLPLIVAEVGTVSTDFAVPITFGLLWTY